MPITTIDKTREEIIKPYENLIGSMENVYIFGAKVLGQRLAKNFQSVGTNVLGFVDNDKQKQGTYIEGIKIFAPEELNCENENFIIILASLNHHYEISCQLKEMGFKKILPYHILTAYNRNVFTPEFTLDGLYEDYCLNKPKYEWLWGLLEDEKSKNVLNNIIKFRETYDMELYHEINDGIENHYFEDFVPYKGQAFVDGGAFDGDTVKRFYKFTNGKYKKIYFFEPDEKSFNSAKANLASYPNIEFYQKGLSDSEKILKFDARGDLGSIFTEEGTEEIQCVALDDIVKEDQAFIKFDIEGAEVDALNGATRLIKNGSILAICVYHNPTHIWEIPELILGLNQNYKFYLRHYTDIHFETVIYAIPK